MDEFTIEGYKRPTIAIYINMFCPSIAIEGYKRHNLECSQFFLGHMFYTILVYNLCICTVQLKKIIIIYI